MVLPQELILDQDEAYEHPRTYRVFVEDEFRFAFDPTLFPSLDQVIDRVLNHIATLRVDGMREWDLAIWQECRIVAVVRTGADGEPVVSQFAEP